MWTETFKERYYIMCRASAKPPATVTTISTNAKLTQNLKIEGVSSKYIKLPTIANGNYTAFCKAGNQLRNVTKSLKFTVPSE